MPNLKKVGKYPEQDKHMMGCGLESDELRFCWASSDLVTTFKLWFLFLTTHVNQWIGLKVSDSYIKQRKDNHSLISTHEYVI